MATESRFWKDDASGSSDSESEESVKQEVKPVVQAAPTNRWFAKDDESSSDEEEEKRVVKSAKQKQWEHLKQTIRAMNNHKNIDDFAELISGLENLLRIMKKTRGLVDMDKPPGFVIQALAELEDYVNDKFMDKESLKRLTKTKSTSFNILRSQVRKNLDQYRGLIDAWRLNADTFAAESESTEEHSDMSESFSDAESLFSNEEEEEDEDDDDEGSQKKASKKKKAAKIPLVEPPVLRTKAYTPVFEPGEKVDLKLVTKKLREIVATRGRKGFDRADHLRQLVEILEVASTLGPQIQLETLSHLISAYFDSNLGAFNALSQNHWSQVHSLLTTSLALFYEHPECYFPTLTMEETASARNIAMLADLEQDSAAVVVANSVVTSSNLLFQDDSSKDLPKLKANSDLIFTLYIERLDDELTKSLQLADVHSEEYKARLSQSLELLVLMWKAQIYLKKNHNLQCKKALNLRILEHLYYVGVNIAPRMWELILNGLDQEEIDALTAADINADTVVERLCKECLTESTDNATLVRVVLYRAYNLCLRSQYYEARDLVVASNLYDMACQQNVSTQVLYNRTIVQLGFAAFSLGLIQEAHTHLGEVYYMGRCRELLAQGLSTVPRGVEKSPEQERLEKRRILPYHTHIPAELVEAIYNCSAMLLEIPLMASNTVDSSRRQISKHFRKMLDTYDRQVLIAPPEIPRETVLAAAKALQIGQWKKCFEYLLTLKLWEAFPDPEKVKQTIKLQIQQEALKTYLLQYSCHYDSFCVKVLSKTFELPPSTTHSILSKMMMQGTLSGSWDKSAEFVLINRSERTPLQHMALQLSEKLVSSTEELELLFGYRNPKFVMTQASQRDDRGRRYDDRWVDRRPYHLRDDYTAEFRGPGGGGPGGYQRWDHWGDNRQRFARQHAPLMNKVDARLRKRI